MSTNFAAQSTYWSDKSLNIHVSVLEGSLQHEDKKLLPDGEMGNFITIKLKLL